MLVKLQRPPPEMRIFSATFSEWSRRTTEQPSWPAMAAQCRPAAPAPTMATSNCTRGAGAASGGRGARTDDSGAQGADERPEQQQDGQPGDAADERVRPEDRQASLREQHRLAEARLGHVAENERQHHRRERVAQLLEEVADDAEDQ